MRECASACVQGYIYLLLLLIIIIIIREVFGTTIFFIFKTVLQNLINITKVSESQLYQHTKTLQIGVNLLQTLYFVNNRLSQQNMP